MTLPLPPGHLQARVGDAATFEAAGKVCADFLRGAVPPECFNPGRAILDFGCGCGRTLRHLSDVAQTCEIVGCDIDRESVAWINAAMSPPFRAVACATTPPIDLPSNYFDVIYAFSVFTHIADDWAAWLLELRRLVKDDGWIIATFLGPEFSRLCALRELRDDDIGFLPTRLANNWEKGGPMVLMSPWWLERHWGRAFRIVSLQPSGFAASVLEHGPYQGSVVMRPRTELLSNTDLEAPEMSDPREYWSAVMANRILRNEIRELAER
jgi:SAM-dependent methyltransferase